MSVAKHRNAQKLLVNSILIAAVFYFMVSHERNPNSLYLCES